MVCVLGWLDGSVNGAGVGVCVLLVLMMGLVL